MKLRWISLTLILLLLAGLALATNPLTATQQMAETENLQCTACHDKPGSKLMTDKGKYYELMGSFEGYDELSKAFTSCTDCHVKKPGSDKLSAKGKKFYSSVKDMEGLREWLMSAHPEKPVEEPEKN